MLIRGATFIIRKSGSLFRDANTSLAFNAGIRSGYGAAPFAFPSATHIPRGFLRDPTIPALCKGFAQTFFASTVFAVGSIIRPPGPFVK